MWCFQIVLVEVTLRGPISEDTGVVMNVQDFKALVDAAVYKNMEKDSDYLKNVGCTTENMCVLVWNNLKSLLPNPDLLHEVKVFATEVEIVSYRGETTYP
ncbi:hypothetical protein PR048_020135 [Dryococelus australis]|uniref:6-pyruvoyltetrahydropterin synthase n=1 Tax=Dryococelus australis TaxID=614101 RepID=A0ABQ9H5F5_9NEOP|nr:hypothetical protein PR048_020135 [Dryococelus australis]